MLHDIIFALWFLLPAALANATPIFSAKIPGLRKWETPLDGGRKFRGKEMLGSHKTWRGLISGIIVSTAVFWLQQIGTSHLAWAHSVVTGVNYAALPTFILGPLFGVGALGGDALESFCKRQRGIPSGHRWLPFDQLDYIVGAMLVTLPFIILPLREYLWMLVLWFVVHLLSSYIGWLLKLKDKPI